MISRVLFVLAFSFCLVQSASANSEFREVLPTGECPPVVSGESSWETNFPGAARQPLGNLANRIVFTTGGHGWTWGGRKGWYTQRGVSQEMNEDYGNLDQQNSFVPYVFNAGATVVAFRPIGQQTNEVILDNDSGDVAFAGAWYESSSEIYFGRTNAIPYRFAPLASAETATAAYTPRIPATGFYPVYTWARHGADRTSQLYRILHTGGQTLVRVPHHMVGNGWVYLGTYFFEKGSHRGKGSVVISNLQPSPGFGSVAIADAIRFGNGMGDFIPEGGTISGYPREEEAARYWVERSLGQGQTNFLAGDDRDHQGRNVGAPVRMAREMNREAHGNMFQRIYLGFHSNAGGGRGVVGLWNNPELFPGTKTPNQQRWAELLGLEVNNTLTTISSPPLEVPWFPRTRLTYARDDYPFGELNDRYIGGEFDATILEVAFHDSNDDARLLRDPKVRDLLSRCSYQATVRYMHEFDGVPLEFISEPPRNVRVRNSAAGLVVGWDRPNDVKRNIPEGYLVYRSEDGYGFGNPVRVSPTQSFLRIENLPQNKTYYFRVTAINAAGESLPSAVVGGRSTRKENATRILFVNGFDQFDRLNNPRQTIEATRYVAPSAFGKMERVISRMNNAFDYVVQHAEALGKRKVTFDSCQREAIGSGFIRLEDYNIVIWASGRQQSNLLDQSEERALNNYIQAGGNLFLSGAYLQLNSAGEDTSSILRPILDCGVCPSQTASVSVAHGEKSGIFHGNESARFGEALSRCYPLASTRILTPSENVRASLYYAEDSGVAAVQFEDPLNQGKIVCFGFPFETIASNETRVEYLHDILNFFQRKKREPLLAPRLAAISIPETEIW